MRKISEYAALAALGLAFAAVPAAPAPAAEGDQVKYTQVQRDDMPKAVRHEADEQARDGKDIKYQRQNRDGKTFYSVHWTTNDNKRMEVRLDESGKVVDGPHAAKASSNGGAAPADNNDSGVKFHGISNKDVKREVPGPVLDTMNQHTQGASDLFYQRQLRQDGKTYYSVHYTKDDKRMFVRVDDKGKVALGPQESQTTTRNRANPDFAKAPADQPAGQPAVAMKRETINGDLLPTPVRRTVEQTMANGGGHVFHKETRGDEVTYVVDYTVGEQQTSARVAADGRVIEASPLANVQPNRPAAQPPVSAPQQPSAESEAQLAAARESAQREADATAASAAAAAGPYQLLTGADQLPAEARAAVEKSIEAGSSDLLVQRFGRDNQNVYSVHFTTPKGQRHFMAVDQTGKVVIEPRKSNAQEGGKGVRFEPITGDQLPPEVRKEVETNGGSGHLFLARTEPNGERTYFVQYTGAKGDRLESRFNANGKEIGKPRAAREQPFTILDRKGD
jgi:hypothetical protein